MMSASKVSTTPVTMTRVSTSETSGTASCPSTKTTEPTTSVFTFAEPISVKSELSERYKYGVLLDRLGGKPLTLATSFLRHPTPYTKAVEALKENYGQYHNLARGEINRILTLPTIKPGDYEAFDNFALSIQSLVGLLTSVDGNDCYELKTASHVDTLLKKLPGSLRDNFVEYCLNKGVISNTKNYDLVSFSQWLNVKSRARRIAAHAVADKTNTTKSDSKTKQATAMLNTPTGYKTPSTSYQSYCAYCNSKDHHVNACESFHKLETRDVLQWIKDKNRCIRCGRNHKEQDCNLKKPCRECKGRHLTILHAINKLNNITVKKTTSFYLDNPNNVMLKIVPVTLHGKCDIETFALLDDGSMRSMILSSAVNDLELSIKPDSILLTTIQSEPFPCDGHRVNLSISSPFDPDTKHEIKNVFTSEQMNLSNYTYPVKDIQEIYPHLKNLPLPAISDAKPLILIGSDNADLILPLQPVRAGPQGTPVAIYTRLGWSLQGPCAFEPNRKQHCFLTRTLHEPQLQITDDVERLWKIDILPYTTKQVTRSKLDHFAFKTLEDKTVKVTVDSEIHFATPLFRIPDKTVLKTGKESVLENMRRTERRLSKHPDIASIHNEKIQELVVKGYVKLISEEEASSTPESWFIPHHVIAQHGKHRLVFNCSYEYQKLSLNKQLLPGPTLGASLLGVFLRFRQHIIAVSGDIKAMFHQIRLLPEDRNLLRFIWREMDTERDVSIYEWQVLPFGTTCSPCCATYAIQRLGTENKEEYPDVHQAVKDSFYVDNCLSGFPSVDKAREFISRLRHVMKSGGFNIRQWISNDPDVVKDLPSEARSETCELWLMQGNTEPHEGTLGLQWQCEKDRITYKYRPIAYSTLTLNVVYRILASQYDPLGFLTPYLARAKVIVQQLWQHKPQWGEPLPECELLTEWHLWESELKLMNQVSLPRCIDPPEPVNQRQLHIFCDASEKVYGSVAYLKSETNDGSSHVSFVAARSRVAPKKALSMPRLELLAALTGAQLASTLTSEMTIDIHKVIMWSDSTTVLAWLTSQSCRYKVFVGTRVAEIQTLTEYHDWRYIPSEENPADDITRGKTLQDLCAETRWRNGPAFLNLSDTEWPLSNAKPKPETDPCSVELKKAFCSHITVQPKADTSLHRSWEKLLDATINTIEDPDGAASINVTDVEKAELQLYRQAQEECFPDEMKALSKGLRIASNSRLSQLSPENMTLTSTTMVLKDYTVKSEENSGFFEAVKLLKNIRDNAMIVRKGEQIQ
ncbi:uncharacterized protein LOC124119260 [Haliotis rufescens]|uniref:uncharacterized protein LOC124119260 n=1 Tax=Haliotis rufescens TaxID=6454 RepID=UPI00201EF482|nr:uncharacterized protein LOC124119260 [Haliotis rufescens]